jgi:hypothetical protein
MSPAQSLQRSIDQLSRTGTGGRNQQLNRTAFRAGRMVAAGGLERTQVENALFEASILNGLVHDDGALAVRATIVSGIAAGIRAPARHPYSFVLPPRPPALPPEATAQAEKVLKLWLRGVRVEGTAAETYVRARAYGGPIPPTFRFLRPSGNCPPALMVPFGIPREPEVGVLQVDEQRIAALQLTKLLPDGRDRVREGAAKIIVGRGSRSVPIVIAPINDLLGLAIVEGIEDGLSVHEATGLGVWASGGNGRMPALAEAVPGFVEAVTIFQHPDADREVEALAFALDARGNIDVFIHRAGALRG